MGQTLDTEAGTLQMLLWQGRGRGLGIRVLQLCPQRKHNRDGTKLKCDSASVCQHSNMPQAFQTTQSFLLGQRLEQQ